MQPAQLESEPIGLFTWAATHPRLRYARRAGDLGNELCGALISQPLKGLECDLAGSTGLALLGAAGVTSAPVVDDNDVLVGVVFLSTLAGLRDLRRVEIEDAMDTEPVTAPQRATVAEVARLMAEHDLDRLPLVTQDGHLVGVITAMDLVRWLVTQLP